MLPNTIVYRGRSKLQLYTGRDWGQRQVALLRIYTNMRWELSLVRSSTCTKALRFSSVLMRNNFLLSHVTNIIFLNNLICEVRSNRSLEDTQRVKVCREKRSRKQRHRSRKQNKKKKMRHISRTQQKGSRYVIYQQVFRSLKFWAQIGIRWERWSGIRCLDQLMHANNM